MGEPVMRAFITCILTLATVSAPAAEPIPPPAFVVQTFAAGVRSEDSATVVERETSHCSQISGVRPLRTEIMRATPASYHPAPAQRVRRTDLAFVVEFIAVRADDEALDEYRETMRASIGPAVGLLVRDNQFYSMIGLETTRVLTGGSAASGAGL